MLINALRFIARVGGIVLLLCLCRSQAEPLMEAAFAGSLPATGWVILIYLVLIGTACALVLPLTAAVIVISLICSASDIFRHHLNLILRDAAALRCGR
ncbi:hypothetical protein ACNY68_20735 [Pantoea sp. KXB25]|uniref:hypothetical protein n=1 Tax=unclassified Pantoea TaxID=2630326 RepID=UPI003AB41515